MKTLRLKKLTRARMEHWLREHSSWKFNCCSAAKCPVAHYITDVYKGIRLVYVGTDTGIIWTDVGQKEIHIPSWACKFIHQVDTQEIGSKITGKQALGILQSI